MTVGIAVKERILELWPRAGDLHQQAVYHQRRNPINRKQYCQRTE